MKPNKLPSPSFAIVEAMETKSGKPIFPIGIGTFGIATRINSAHADSKYRGIEPLHGYEDEEIEAVRYSLTKGQNHIDCAELYGGFYTDEVIGKAIAGSTREDLYIADKLWKTSVGRGLARQTVKQMLQKLGTDYIDLLYIHSPWQDVDWREAIPQIDALIDEGIVRHFGVSNFSIDDMVQALKLAKRPIVANQMHYNVLHQHEVEGAFTAFCNEHDIKIVAYQPVKRREVLSDKTIQKIAQAHGVSPAQIAIAWLLAKQTLPIPKAVTKEHIDENVAAVDITLSAQEMAALDRLG
jgi:2,5-diketo-D-gluconate reductase B